jgi:very-short-patch-repair endonuclease
MREDNPALRAFARRMRREPTVAEQTLWRVVRNRRLAGFKFRRQVPFGPYILDCYCASARLAVEADGDTHATDDGKARDAERTRLLEAQGVLVLRFWNVELADDEDAAAERIANACAARTEQLTTDHE